MRAATGSFETEYLTAGSGPALVLAHSLGGSKDMWWRQLDAFARRYRVVVYDARGHGGSGLGPGEYTVPDLAGDLVRLLDALSIERASIVGLSMGGMMAQCLAAAHPDRLDKLVLADTTSHYEGEGVTMWRQRAQAARAGGLEGMTEATMERWFTPGFRRQQPEDVARVRAIFAANDPEGYARAAGALSRFDVRSRLAAITAPTLVMCGDQDTATPPEHGRFIAATVQRGRFELIEDASHASCVEQPERFNQLVLDFLAG